MCQLLIPPSSPAPLEGWRELMAQKAKFRWETPTVLITKVCARQVNDSYANAHHHIVGDLITQTQKGALPPFLENGIRQSLCKN